MNLCVLAFLALLYIPFAGNYGLWDPWETHYGEVARQMVARNDWISLWWPGSPLDVSTGVFFSKPVLTFWLMALSLKVFGLGHDGAAYASEMTTGWRAEWALRMPLILMGIAGIWATYVLVRRLASRRAALWTVLVLSTSTQWALITRQAMTDMAFVVPMTVAVVFAGLALIAPRRDPADPETRSNPLTEDLPRRSRAFGRYTLEWPHAPAFYGAMALYVLCVAPQLLVNLIQLRSFSLAVFGHTYRVIGAIAVVPFWILFGVSLWWCCRARTRQQIYLWVAYVMGALATLAKGPAGIALPMITLLVYILVSGRLTEFFGFRESDDRKLAQRMHRLPLPSPLRDLLASLTSLEYRGGLELGLGILMFLCVGAPWYVAMLARHGMPFWMELIGDNYVHRAQGRHGDRGTFEYYLRQLGAGMFPWSGIVASAVLCAGRWLRGDGTSRRHLALLALSWFVVDFCVVSVVNTKFHHYILPALPALAILAGLLLDELCEGAARSELFSPKTALLVVGLPITFLSGRDLAAFPARIGWLFNYDYVNVPGTGRAWPVTATYGERYEYGDQILWFTLLLTVLTALVVFAVRRARPQTEPALETTETLPPWLLPGAAIAFGVLLFFGIRIAPSPDAVSMFSSSKLPTTTVLPRYMRLGYLLPAAAAALWLCGTLWAGRVRGRAAAIALLGFGAIAWTTWVLDRYLIDLSPHWSQKHVFASYYKNRTGPQEPVVAWMMYWRGENFYTANQIYDHRLDASEKTVFLGDKNTEKLQAYLNAHRGRRIYFLIERHRLEVLRGALPEASRKTLEVVDDSNNKVYLARAQL